MKKIKLGILRSFKDIDFLIEQYVESCKELKIEYVILDLLSENWIEEIKESKVDGILVRIMANIEEHKSLYDERLYIIEDELNIPIYPSRKELFLYENKRLYEYWLTANKYKHPKTDVFYRKEDALKFIRNSKYPLVFKTSSGAGASGVTIVKNKFHAFWYTMQVFGFFDYRLSLGKTMWSKKKIIPFPKFGVTQKHYLLAQEYLDIKWEWRIIKIGDSFFGHQKLLKGRFASGSGMVGWVKPPEELLFLVKEICEKGKFDSMAMDVLETKNGEYFINEIQSLFGGLLPSQMRINDIPGRYVFKNDNFVFEKGEFNRFGSNLLRVEDFCNKLNSGYYKKI